MCVSIIFILLFMQEYLPTLINHLERDEEMVTELCNLKYHYFVSIRYDPDE